MQFCVIIPVFEAGAKISTTLHSVLSQTALDGSPHTVSCIVVDGASTDDTCARVAAFEDPRIILISEADTGMYDALAKGLARAQGDVTCYLPAGEQFDPNAFSVVTDVFTQFPKVSWLTGRAVTRNAAGQITESRLPHPFKRNFVICGMYGTRLNAVQQESTFWRSDLNALVDLEKLRSLRLAGDYFLWKSFAQQEDLYVVNTQLASFTIEPGQLSRQTPGAYRKELRSLRRKPTLLERLHALLHRQYSKVMRPGRNAPRLIAYDHRIPGWRLSRG